MKFLVLVLSLVGAVFARPDVSELSGNGYNYNQPSQNGFSGIGSANSPSGSYLPGGGSNFLGGNIGGFDGSGSLGGLGGSIGVGGGYNPNSVQDQKHVYFYAAPDDEAPARLRINVGASSQKNTKIIFIKAPGGGGVIPEVIAPPSQSEDKTLVYVLVKKQDQPGAINIPSSHGVKQAKPEVFFIKYKTQQEAEQAVSGGLNGQSVGSSLSDLGNEQSFVRTLKDSANQGALGGLGGSGGFGGGDFSGGSSLLGSVSGGSQGSNSFGSLGGDSGSFGVSGGLSGKYGTPGASGPY